MIAASVWAGTIRFSVGRATIYCVAARGTTISSAMQGPMSWSAALKDFISGGAGNDDLSGGAGQDKSRFKVGSGRDIVYDFQNDVDTLYIDRDYGFTSVKQLLKFASSSGGDSAIHLSKNSDDSPRIILLGVDNFNKLEDDIILI